jgi:ADP-ribose pyrophosphatase YjhB (NUDIX family)
MEKERFSMLVSIHILFIKNNQILLLLRKNISSDGLYSVVAGHLDGGETVTDAIIREAKEEADVLIEPKDIEFKTVCHSYNQKNQKEFVQFYVICKKWSGEIKNNEPKKCGDLKFFSLNDLPKNMVPYVKIGIAKALKGVKYYEYGWHDED